MVDGKPIGMTEKKNLTPHHFIGRRTLMHAVIFFLATKIDQL